MQASFENITKFFLDKRILNSVTAAIEDNDRIGLIGRNGTGKTTLLNIICGELSFDSGSLNVSRKTTIGYLRQNNDIKSEKTIYEYTKEVFSDLVNLKKEIAELEKIMSSSKADYIKSEERYAAVTTYFEQRGGYNIDVKIKTVLNGMGFGDKELDTVINTLSGGERTRLSIARLLLMQPSLLVLDEPTNHLDFETLSWLEQYLSEYKGAVLTVSHDRFFLDKTVSRIWEIEGDELSVFKGNYSKYLALKEEKRSRKQKEYDEQQKKITQLRDYAAKNIVRASTSKSAKSRLNALDRIEPVSAPKKSGKTMKMKFEFDFEPNFDVLGVENLHLCVGSGCDKKVLCESVSFSLEIGDKLAVIGANGTGKTTLLKVIKNYPSVLREIRWGGNVRIGYYDQHLSVLNPDNTVMEELWSRFPGRDQLSIRTTLGRALFRNDDVEKRVGDLSGGEKARLSIAILMQQRPNVLIMDEPTNHLDLEVREIIERALCEYSGTLILVSHDRYFLEKIPDRILCIKDNKAKFFKGGYREFCKKVESEIGSSSAEGKRPREKKNGSSSFRSKQQRAIDTQKKLKLTQLEKRLGELECEIKDLEAQLILPEVFVDFKRSSKICTELNELKKSYDDAFEQWAEAGEEING